MFVLTLYIYCSKCGNVVDLNNRGAQGWAQLNKSMREWKTRHRLNRYVVTDISRNTKQLLVLNVFFLLKVLDEGMFISFVG